MYNNNGFLRQVQLILRCLPAIRDQNKFALKGGTAINLFVRNLPRLSVDIDLTYIAIEDRESSVRGIQDSLRDIANAIKQLDSHFVIKEQFTKKSHLLTRLHVYDESTLIKVEPNFVSRGTLYPVEEGSLCSAVNDQFNAYLNKVPILNINDLYAGKICAALNRQHPRDLFDTKLLLENEGISDQMRQAFVIYLAGDSRPMHELLAPHLLDISTVFEREFAEMTTIPVKLSELLNVRKQLIRTIQEELTENERRFLLSMKLGEPEYHLMPFNHLVSLPSLAWKIINVRKNGSNKAQTDGGKIKGCAQAMRS